MTEEKKEGKQLTPEETAGQLKSSIANVASLPITAIKLTESFKTEDAEE
jgi:hypothetical protein